MLLFVLGLFASMLWTFHRQREKLPTSHVLRNRPQAHQPWADAVGEVGLYNPLSYLGLQIRSHIYPQNFNNVHQNETMLLKHMFSSHALLYPGIGYMACHM